MTAPVAPKWGDATLPFPRRLDTGGIEFNPVGSSVDGPDGNNFTTAFGYKKFISYTFENLSQVEKDAIKDAYLLYAKTPTTLRVLTGEEYTVTGFLFPLQITVFYDRFHVPHYSCVLRWRVVGLVGT